MADIGSLETAIRKAKRDKGKKSQKSVSQRANTTLSPQQWDLIKSFFVVVIIALLGVIFTMLASYFQFVQNTYHEYAQALSEYNNSRYDKLDARVKDLENKLNVIQSGR